MQSLGNCFLRPEDMKQENMCIVLKSHHGRNPLFLTQYTLLDIDTETIQLCSYKLHWHRKDQHCIRQNLKKRTREQWQKMMNLDEACTVFMIWSATLLHLWGIRHRLHHFATQASHFVDRAGWQAKMASLEFWIPWRNAHCPQLK